MICDELFSINEHLQNIIKVFTKKKTLIRDDKLILSKIETKSNNLKALSEELLNQLHSFYL